MTRSQSISMNRTSSVDTTVTNEFEVQFVREQFQELLRRKDRLIEKQEEKIADLRKQLAKKKKVIYVHGAKRIHRDDDSSPTLSTTQKTLDIKSLPLRKSTGFAISDQINLIQQHNQFIEAHIENLREQLENAQNTAQRLQNKVASQNVKLQDKTQQIHLLQQECAKYYAQCSDLKHIEEIVQKAANVTTKHIVLDGAQKITVSKLMETVKANAEQQAGRNEIDFVAAALQKHCNTLSAMSFRSKGRVNFSSDSHSHSSSMSTSSSVSSEFEETVSTLLSEQKKLKERNQELSTNIVGQTEEIEALRLSVKRKEIEIENMQNERQLLKELIMTRNLDEM